MTVNSSDVSVDAESSNEISVTVDFVQSAEVAVESGEPSFVIDCSLPVQATAQPAGPPGTSAYDIWLLQPANSGKTVLEYLESLRGPPGPPGPRGEPGPPSQDTTGLGGFPFVFTDIVPGDFIEFSDANAWVNGKPQSLTDGGNF